MLLLQGRRGTFHFDQRRSIGSLCSYAKSRTLTSLSAVSSRLDEPSFMTVMVLPTELMGLFPASAVADTTKGQDEEETSSGNGSQFCEIRAPITRLAGIVHTDTNY
jgi:hypothetical protein